METLAKKTFIVWTNHKNLEYLRSAKRLNRRQARGGPCSLAGFTSLYLTEPELKTWNPMLYPRCSRPQRRRQVVAENSSFLIEFVWLWPWLTWRQRSERPLTIKIPLRIPQRIVCLFLTTWLERFWNSVIALVCSFIVGSQKQSKSFSLTCGAPSWSLMSRTLYSIEPS